MPPPTVKRRQPADAGEVLRFRVDGAEYRLERGELSDRIERELFVQAGITTQQAFSAVAAGAAFGVAALVFLAKRTAGQPAQYAQIEQALEEARRAAGDEFDLEVLADDSDGGGDNPPG